VSLIKKKAALKRKAVKSTLENILLTILKANGTSDYFSVGLFDMFVLTDFIKILSETILYHFSSIQHITIIKHGFAILRCY